MRVPLARFFSLPGTLAVHGASSTSTSLALNTRPALQVDSRDCHRGDLFVALRGTQIDSHTFVSTLLSKGVHVVVDREGFRALQSGTDLSRFASLTANDEALPEPSLESPDTPVIIVVRDTRDWLARAAASLAGLEKEELKVYGFTGTNGKSTCTWILQHLLLEKDPHCGLIGTIEHRLGNAAPSASTLTTPDAIGLASFAENLLQSGGRHLVMEVSSHAIDQRREAVFGFDVVAFLNLTPEHLDYHHDMENYFKVKASFMARPESSLRLVNADDPFGQRLLDELPPLPVRSFGWSPQADWHLLKLTQSRNNLEIEFSFEGISYQLQAPLIGAFNGMNLLTTVAVAMHAGLDMETIQNRLRSLPPVPGRMEACTLPERAEGTAPTVLIDYAHSPDGYKKVFEALSTSGFQRIHTVFGCGGERDRLKRPQMLAFAESGSNQIFLTLDNPRNEDAEQIFADTLGDGFHRSVQRIDDREAAIQAALKGLGSKDLLLLLGKGHERYQILGEERVPFDEREVVARAWEKEPSRESLSERSEESQERIVLILGAARSGLAAASLASKHGWQVWLADDRDPNAALLHRIQKTGAQLWPKGEVLPDNIDLLVLSPAIPPSHIFVRKAEEQNVPVCSEVDFARSYFNGKVLGITGSNGKTTTTLLLTAILKAAGHQVQACGNIGLPFSQVVEENPNCEFAVLELSSYQLEMSQDLRLNAGAILNVTPDHLERHGTMDAYLEAKLRLSTQLNCEAPCVINHNDDCLSKAFSVMDSTTSFRLLSFGSAMGLDARIQNDSLFINEETPFFSAEEWTLQGQHNLENLAAAALIAQSLGIAPSTIQQAARHFQPVPHRIELVAEENGIRWVNDSKATNLEASLPALRSQPDASVLLLAGGKGKTEDYQEALDLVRMKVHTLIVYGEDGPVIGHYFESIVPVIHCATLEEAVGKAAGAARPGDVVLLSPMCASFDQFPNFEARGECFRAAVVGAIALATTTSTTLPDKEPLDV